MFLFYGACVRIDIHLQKEKSRMTNTNTDNFNARVSNLLIELDAQVTFNNRRFETNELIAIYNIGSGIYKFYTIARDTTNLGLFAMNVNTWRLTGWNPEYILPVAASGFIWLRNTSIFGKALRWSAGFLSGWNSNKTIRNGIKLARAESIYEVVAGAGIVYGLTWHFSPLTWMLCMSAAIFRGIYYSFAVYGLNYMLTAEFNNRLVNFLSETLGSMANEMLPSGQPTQKFEELVDTETFPDTDPQSCPICMQDDRVSIARIKSCRHSFCQECLQAWYHRPVRIFNCPMCRIDLDTPIDRVPLIRDTLTQLLR